MRNALLSLFAGLALAACAATPALDPKEAKIAFDVTDGNPQVLILKLTIIDLTRKQLIDSGVTPKMVIAFRGDASYYTQTNLSMVKEADRADALQVAARIRALKAASGVEALEQCNVPLAARKLKPADIMREVRLVPNGWIALADYQQKGYSYIVP